MMEKFKAKDETYFKNYTYQRDNTSAYRFEYKLKFPTQEMRIYKWGCAATSWNPNVELAKYDLDVEGGVFKAPYSVKPPK